MNYRRIIALTCISALLAGCTAEAAAENNDSKQMPAEEDIIVSGGGSPDLIEHFNGTADMLSKCDAVIYGEVTDFEMAAAEGSGFIHTLETIHVIESLYGDAEEGTDIRLNETGGYALAIDTINAFATEEERRIHREFMFDKLSDEELNTKYVAEVPDGYYYPEIGDRAVYCLKWLEGYEGIYRISGGWQGKYREIEDGVLVKPNISNSVTNPEGKADTAETITYEQLKEEIQQALAK